MLIVRVWIEASHEKGLRARITSALGESTAEQSVSVASSAEDICAIVKQWVDDFTTPGSPDGNGQGTRR
jgi:hypothetical protein